MQVTRVGGGQQAPEEALETRATAHDALIPQWLSAGWGDEMAVFHSFLSRNDHLHNLELLFGRGR